MSKDIKKDYTDEILKNNVIARFESHGERFEILIPPEAAERIRNGDPLVIEDLASEFIFFDAKNGNKASEESLNEVFGTTKVEEVAQTIILKGDIQLTTDQRRRMQEKKRKLIVDRIVRNSMDPATKTPHPRQRIELAMDEAKVHIDPFRSADAQLKAVVDALRPIIPLSMDQVKISVKIPAHHTGKAYGVVRGFGSLEREEWQSDGSWLGVVKLPAGLQNDFYDRLNEATKGEAETRILK